MKKALPHLAAWAIAAAFYAVMASALFIGARAAFSPLWVALTGGGETSFTGWAAALVGALGGVVGAVFVCRFIAAQVARSVKAWHEPQEGAGGPHEA